MAGAISAEHLECREQFETKIVETTMTVAETCDFEYDFDILEEDLNGAPCRGVIAQWVHLDMQNSNGNLYINEVTVYGEDEDNALPIVNSSSTSIGVGSAEESLSACSDSKSCTFCSTSRPNAYFDLGSPQCIRAIDIQNHPGDHADPAVVGLDTFFGTGENAQNNIIDAKISVRKEKTGEDLWVKHITMPPKRR